MEWFVWGVIANGSGQVLDPHEMAEPAPVPGVEEDAPGHGATSSEPGIWAMRVASVITAIA